MFDPRCLREVLPPGEGRYSDICEYVFGCGSVERFLNRSDENGLFESSGPG
jgi:hypothetical protein